MINLLGRIIRYLRRPEFPSRTRQTPKKIPVSRKNQNTTLDLIPQEQKDTWIQEYLAYASVPEIATRHDVNPHFVRKHLNATGNTYESIQKKKAVIWIAKFEAGKTIMEIANEEPKGGRTSISHALQLAGVQGINRGRRRESIDLEEKLQKACDLRLQGNSWQEIARTLNETNFKNLNDRAVSYAVRKGISLPKFRAPNANSPSPAQKKFWESLYNKGLSTSEILKADPKATRKRVLRHLKQAEIYIPKTHKSKETQDS